MNEPPPRLRMFGGPNGSGKSTLKSYLPPKLLGIFKNQRNASMVQALCFGQDNMIGVRQLTGRCNA